MAGTQSAELIKLMEELKALESEKNAVKNEEHDILNGIDDLEEDRPTKEELVVAFVKEIEKAYQYFELKEYLKGKTELMENWDKIAIFEQLVKTEKVHYTYDKLDFKDIMYVVQEGYGSAVLNPLTKLVQMMKAGYIIEEDPHKELLKLKKADAFFYHKIFIWKLFDNSSANTVTLRFIPDEMTKDEVKCLVEGCGDVASVDFDYCVGPGDKIANVTFKDSESAKLAPILMGRTYHTVLPFPEYRERLPDAPSSAEYQEAVKKYKAFRNRNMISKERENADTAELPVDPSTI